MYVCMRVHAHKHAQIERGIMKAQFQHIKALSPPIIYIIIQDKFKQKYSELCIRLAVFTKYVMFLCIQYCIF